MTNRNVVSREDAAQIEFEEFDFQGSIVEAFNGWEYTIPGDDEWSRTVYFSNDDGGDSISGHFSVTFRPGTSIVQEVYASINGNLFGKRGEDTP